MELHNSEGKRKEFMRPVKRVFWWMLIKLPAIVVLITLLYGKLELKDKVPQLVNDVMGVTMEMCVALPVVSCIFIGAYLLYCSGRSSVHKITLFNDVLVYSYYSGSGGNRETTTFKIKEISGYEKNSRQFVVYGDLVKKESGRTGPGTWNRSKVRIPRTFEEDELIEQFLQTHSKEGIRKNTSKFAQLYNYL